MGYRTFSGYRLGYSHVRDGSGCEDYAMSYSDKEGRYYICAVCDGHSDKNCFRSGKGALFGCESAIETWIRFFELYYGQNMESQEVSPEMEERLKRSMKQRWDKKVFQDIKENPLSGEELEPLSERVRKIYESGQGLQNIYGATFLAAAVCKDFFAALHIGDGIMMCVYPDGTYGEPLPYDAKSEMGSPASLCDSDLFSRKDAFRSVFSKTVPQAVVASSDGIGDCMDKLQFREFVHALAEKFETMEQPDTGQDGLNAAQEKYLGSCLEYWADKGNGVEDDCSLAGIYDCSLSIPEVRLPLDVAEKLWEDTVLERNDTILDYERRKMDIVHSISQQQEASVGILKRAGANEEWIGAKDKVENLKQILRNMESNEQEKVRYYDGRLESCREYIRRAQGSVPAGVALIMPQAIEEKYLAEDRMFASAKAAQEDFRKKEAVEREAARDRELADRSYKEATRKAAMARGEAERLAAEKEAEEAWAVLLERAAKQEEAREALGNTKEVLKNAVGKAIKNDGERVKRKDKGCWGKV